MCHRDRAVQTAECTREGYASRRSDAGASVRRTGVPVRASPLRRLELKIWPTCLRAYVASGTVSFSYFCCALI